MSENQEDRLLDHYYDGIREYDNPMPFWWKALFWVSIVFSVVYIAFYHGGPGLSVEEEYGQAMIAHLDLQAAQMGDVTEEALADLAADPAKMTGAAHVFVSKCSQCHGQLGEGNIGPNLTDDYWLHGEGALLDIYDSSPTACRPRACSPGRTSSGPPSFWSSRPTGDVEGDRPPNAKAPQGVIPEPGAEVPAEDPQPETWKSVVIAPWEAPSHRKRKNRSCPPSTGTGRGAGFGPSSPRDASTTGVWERRGS